MRLTILTQYYEPETGAPQRRLSSLARNFVAAGHEVTVLTAMPNYPTGKIHSGYGGWISRETTRGISIIRTFIHPTQSTRFLPRLLNYFSFVFSSIVCGTWSLKRSDYLLVESPPLFLGIAALWLSAVKRSRLIFNVSDLWPESAVQLGVISKNGLWYRLAQCLEALCYKKAWLVTGQARTIVADIKSRFPSVRTFLLSNGVETDKFAPELGTADARWLLSPNDEFVVLYAGLLGLAQGLDQVLEAAKALNGCVGLRFVLIGDGPERRALVERAQKECLSNVAFLEPRSAEEIPPLIASADLVVVPLKCSIRGAVPSKLYEAMASARPVVLIAEGEAAEIVESSDCGSVVSPGDVIGLVTAIQTIRSDPNRASVMGANGRRVVMRSFDRKAIGRAFERFLEGHQQPAISGRSKQGAGAPEDYVIESGSGARP